MLLLWNPLQRTDWLMVSALFEEGMYSNQLHLIVSPSTGDAGLKLHLPQSTVLGNDSSSYLFVTIG